MCEQCRTENTDMVEILTAPKAASLAVDAPQAETVDTVDTLRTTLANVVSNTGAEIENLTREVDVLRAGARLAAEVAAEITRTMSTKLDAFGYDFAGYYGAGALELVEETTGRVRGRLTIQGSVAAPLVEWLLPAIWREAFVDSLRDTLRDEIREELADEVREEIEEEIRDEIRDEVRDALSDASRALDNIESEISTVREAVDGI